jgi:HRDC domain
MKSIAAHAPMTMEELEACQVIADQKVQEYGNRIVNTIKHFVEEGNLQEYVQKRSVKRSRAVSSSGDAKKPPPAADSVIEIDDDDEFDDDIDYSAIDLDAVMKTVK